MQVFVPYSSPLDCAKALWDDSKRYNKQIIECRQILDAIDCISKGWRNHPVVKMYKYYREWLAIYYCCLQAYRDAHKFDKSSFGYNATMRMAETYSIEADAIMPPFLTDDFCNQHKRRLYSKSAELYPQFAEYGKSEENWYFVDGKLLKYINGKQVK